MKYLKYFISTITLVSAMYYCSLGAYYPTIYFIGFSSFIIFGDLLFNHDDKIHKYKYPFWLDFPIYINLPLLILFLMMVVFVFSRSGSNFLSLFFFNYLSIDLLSFRESINLVDKISLVALSSLFIGIMGTVPGHELSHRINNKYDLFIGSWLLSLSWDCAFAIEHVYGHHKNVALPKDPATARRGDNIYKFIINAIINEQRDAWQIEKKRLRSKSLHVLGFNNKLIKGYMKSVSISILSYLVGGLAGLLIFLVCAFTAKALLEVINFTEHYGLIRVEGEKVMPRHSWNSNSIMSSIYLYNVTRHSSHHEKAYLKFWELKPYKNSPMMPYGYLTMLYMAVFAPFLFNRVMSKKLIDWDKNFASNEEKALAKIENQRSGLSLLVNQ
ncbi:MAG: alkane 1-monooxygenase [bacterium]